MKLDAGSSKNTVSMAKTVFRFENALVSPILIKGASMRFVLGALIKFRRSPESRFQEGEIAGVRLVARLRSLLGG